MKADYFRFSIALVVALVVGLIAEHVFLCLFIVTFACLIWQQQKVSQLLAWIQNRKHVDAPEVSGNFADICREVDRLKVRHKKRKKKLANYLQQFQLATSALPDATVVLDIDDRIQWANKAAAEYLNIQWPQDQRQCITNLIRSPILLDYLASDTSDRANTVDIISPLNTEIYLSLRIVPYGDNQRLFVARDVTRLQRLIEVRKDFVANVSHELRTPLTVLHGFLETMLRNKQQCPESWHDSLETMSAQSNRMADVISDLLTISHLEEGRFVGKQELVLVAEMIARVHQEALALSVEKQHIFEINVESDLMITGSSKEIYSVISNLVFNAVRYTPDGGVIRIKWSGDELGGAQLLISDNGKGIPAQHLSRLTERFYRVEQSRNRENGGSGLGLSIVKHVLSRHKASLRIESVVDEGSSFYCDFPKEVVKTKKLSSSG